MLNYWKSFKLQPHDKLTTYGFNIEYKIDKCIACKYVV